MEALSLWLLGLSVFVTTLLCVFLFKYCYEPYGLFRKHGIPGPTPVPFFGNFFMIRKLGWIHFPEYYFKKHGPVFGVFVGCGELLVIGDADLVRSIHVDNAHLIIDREAVPDFFSEAVDLPPGLFTSRGEEWKRSRLAIAPAFSSLNLRVVARCIHGTCDKLKDALEVHMNTGESVQMDKLFGKYAMECAVSLVFGEIKGDKMAKERQIFLESAAVLWTNMEENTITMLWFILHHFPWVMKLLGLAMKHTWMGQYYIDMQEAITKMVLTEAQEKKSSKTIAQLMLEAQVKEDGQTRKLTIKEIVSQALTFLMAGYETTSITLGFTAYLLALHPDIQDRLHNEIVDYFKSKPEATLFDAAQEIEYMDMVVHESMRIHPVVPGVVRFCRKTVVLNGVTIPENVTTYAATQQIHHNPKYWPDPEKFIPERFTAEEKAKRPAGVYIPFGLGPRNCIGSRFAKLEIKMMMIQILRAMKFVRAPDTQVPLKTFYKLSVAPKDGIFLGVTKW